MPVAASRFERLPPELRDQVAALAGPLTEHLLGHRHRLLARGRRLLGSLRLRNGDAFDVDGAIAGGEAAASERLASELAARTVWTDALRSGWKGCLEQLPDCVPSMEQATALAESPSDMQNRLASHIQTLLSDAAIAASVASIEARSELRLPFRDWDPVPRRQRGTNPAAEASLRCFFVLLRMAVARRLRAGHTEASVGSSVIAPAFTVLIGFALDAFSDGWTTDAMDNAAALGHLCALKLLAARRPEGCSQCAMNSAAMSGHLHIAEWLHANTSPGCTSWAMDAAAMRGHLSVVVFLHLHWQEGCTTEAVDQAAAAGHADV
ncbi:hypothetical protein HK105_209306, partial [Polyrhizophydium stewartii]